MGLKLGKAKKKEKEEGGKTQRRAWKNTPRNAGSTMSLYETGSGGVNTSPNAYEKTSSSHAGPNSRSKTMPRPAAPGPTAPRRQVIKAMYDYTARYDDDLGFKKGDRMEVITKGDDADWWLVRNIKTKDEGFVPSNYVVADDNSVETQEWWFGSDRREANKQLMLPGNPIGTYLIRNSKEKNSYALSVLDRNEAGDLIIRHYLIRPFDNNGGFFIQEKRKFVDLFELVDHYTAEPGVLKCRLTQPCPKQAMAVPFKELEVKRKDIVTGEKLGAGNFGEVHAGTFRNVVDVAVKSLKPGSMTNAEFLAEAEIMHKLRHPKLVQLMGICTEGKPLLIITERMSHGALIDVLRKDKDTVKFPTMVDMAAQVCDGMSYLESQNYIHRDLRAANILVAENFVVKVADFGLARILNGIYEGDDDVYTASETTKFPVKWTAPEAAREYKFSIKSDVWSFGVLLYELVTYGRIPYADLDNMTAMSQVCKGYRMENPQSDSITCPPQFYEIMLSCWDARPEKRPTFEYLKNVFEDFPVFCEVRYFEDGQ